MQKPSGRHSIYLLALLCCSLFSSCGQEVSTSEREATASTSKVPQRAENKAQVTVDTRLHRASEDGDIQLVLQLLEKSIDVNAIDGQGETPLHKAAARGHARIAEILLNHGARVDAREQNWFGRTPLHMAWYEKDKEVVEVLVEHGAEVNARDNNGNTPLHSAMFPVAEVLIANGADVNVRNDKGKTPLHSAATDGDWAVAELLIGKGADVNARDDHGETPLHSAGSAIITKGYQDGRRTALLLITNGADVNARDLHQDAPLHKAVEINNFAVAETLIANGCDVNAKDRNGSTPLFYAKFKETPQNIIQLLEQHGGKNEGSIPLVKAK